MQRGGARNRRERISNLVTPAQCQGVLAAARRANAIGKPFNVHKTLSLRVMGIPDSNGAGAIGMFIKLLSDWIASKGERLVWAWARENPGGKNSHVHLLLHVPPILAPALRRRQHGWLNRIADRLSGPVRAPARARVATRLTKFLPSRVARPRGKRRIHTTRIGGTLRTFADNPAKHAVNLDAVLSYLLKGAAPATIAALALSKPHKNGGPVTGKRVGWWQERACGGR